MPVDAGGGDTSGMLAVRPNLVRPVYKTLTSRAGRAIDGAGRLPLMNCRVCNGALTTVPYTVRDMMFTVGESFEYRACSECGALQLVTPPSDMGVYYPPTYHSLGTSKFEHPDGWVKRTVLRARTNHALGRRNLYAAGDWLMRRFPEFGMPSLRPLQLAPTTRILDVGCGMGSTIYGLHVAGFKNVMGIDVFVERDVYFPDGRPAILKRSLQEVDGTFDVVMFHHSFEHVPDPLATLQAAARLLSPGGTCLVRVPLCDSFAWQHYREHWVQIDAPRHWVLHTVASLRLLGDAAGLSLTRVVRDSNAFQFWGSEQYVAGIPLVAPRSYAVNPAASMFTPGAIEGFKRQAERLNQEGTGDQGAFYFVKNRQ